MPVTGNNTHTTQKILSIRLRRDGLSFYCTEENISPREVLFADHGDKLSALRSVFDDGTYSGLDRINIFVDTAQCVFIPAEVTDMALPEHWLAEMSIHTAPDETAVISAPSSMICAAFAVDTAIYEWVEYKFGTSAEWLSPMHELIAAAHGSVTPSGKGYFAVYPTNDNIYIMAAAADGSASALEVYPLKSTADIIYFLNALCPTECKCNDMTVYIHGDRPPRHTRFLRRYFKKVKTI